MWKLAGQLPYSRTAAATACWLVLENTLRLHSGRVFVLLLIMITSKQASCLWEGTLHQLLIGGKKAADKWAACGNN
jgi:hypothetical protein